MNGLIISPSDVHRTLFVMHGDGIFELFYIAFVLCAPCSKTVSHTNLLSHSHQPEPNKCSPFARAHTQARAFRQSLQFDSILSCLAKILNRVYTRARTHLHMHIQRISRLLNARKGSVDIVFSSIPFTIYASSRFGTRWPHAFVLIVFFSPGLGNRDWKMVATTIKL